MLITSSVLATQSNCVGLELFISDGVNCPERSNLMITAAITRGSTFVSSKTVGFRGHNITLRPERLLPGTYNCVISAKDNSVVVETTEYFCNISKSNNGEQWVLHHRTCSVYSFSLILRFLDWKEEEKT